MTPAQAERARPASPPVVAPEVPAPETQVINCYGAWRLESCVITSRDGRINPHVIHVPLPVSDEARAAAEARDRRWVARCRPAIQQDHYGMPRYIYAAAGCEFGVLD
jgi:hypothetical protein